MKSFQWKVLLPHVIAIVLFALISVIYCKPALEGKVVQQHDVTQWKGMAQNSMDYKAKHNVFPLWTNGMFSGMPAYQIAIGGEENITSLRPLMQIATLNFPSPVKYFFLACVCFYFLSQVLKVNPYIGIVGALGYAYATYNPIIIGAGHETKMMAIAILPSLIGAILLIFNKKYLWGVALTGFASASLIGANHMQITYYGFMIVGAMSLSYLIFWIKEKNFKHAAIALSLTALGVATGVGTNAVNMATTYEYSKETIRGGSVLADKNSKSSTNGLNKDYAFSYSMYKTEPLVMVFPYLYGGSTSNLEVAEDKSKAIKALQEMPQELSKQLQNYLQFYWGGIGGTSGPPYVGAIICFLALMGMVFLNDKYRWWMLGISLLAVVMSWGQYFEGFSLFLLNNLPMYNKFRAPSMIIVIPTLVFTLMATLSLDTMLKFEDKDLLWKKMQKGLIIVGSVFAFALIIYLSSDFMGEADKGLSKQISQIQDPQQRESLQQPVRSFIAGLQQDRKDLFLGSVFRSLLFMLVPVVALFFYSRKKINSNIVIAGIGLFAFVDVMSIDVKYLSEEHFIDDNDTETTFKKTDVDNEILKDTSYYRVFNLMQGPQAAFNQGALNSYYHKSIGGYHPAKLSIYQDLIEHQLYNFPNCMPVINMLNTKYIITPNQQTGQPQLQTNPQALGPCWFVKGIVFKKTPLEVMNYLTNFDTKDSAIVFEADKSLVVAPQQTDSLAKIQLVVNDNDYVEYKSNSTTNQYAVFSEVYYSKGWKALVDGKETPIIKTNYVLRGINLPAGNHKIVFEFKPASFYSSNVYAIISTSFIWLTLLSSIALYFISKKKEQTTKA